ncbi:hypothetical protein [Streptomyces sp. NPDC055709]
MSNHAASRTETGRESEGPVPGRIGTVICASLLIVGHLVTGFVSVTAYMASPAGPWDTESVAHSGFAAGLALALATATALLTLLFRKAEWLTRGWWYVIPAALATAALLRLTLLAPDV